MVLYTKISLANLICACDPAVLEYQAYHKKYIFHYDLQLVVQIFLEMVNV
jgi:hypothetical protein